MSRKQIYIRQHGFLLICCTIFAVFAFVQTVRVIILQNRLAEIPTKVEEIDPSPAPTAEPEIDEIPTIIVTPTPIPSLGDDPEDQYTGPVLNPTIGTVDGPSGKETYYNLPMEYVVELMRDLGYSLEEYPYWVREDGCKMFGPYIMCAANLEIRPKGTILKSSLGDCMVCDTGEFVNWNPTQIDIAVNW